VTIRAKLLLLGLVTISLPWAGCQYAREMESLLRVAEQQALLAVAQTIATSLQGRRDLLLRGAANAPLVAGPNDFEALPLSAEPVLDGSPDEWPRDAPASRSFKSAQGDELRVLTGTRGRFLHLLLEATDQRLVFDRADAAALESEQLGDRVWLALDDESGYGWQYFIASTAAGAVRARRIETREYGREEVVEEPRIRGRWQPTASGWRLELRLPLSMVRNGLGVLVDDRDRRGANATSYGSLAAQDLAIRGRLIAAAPELHDYLARFRQPGVRLVAATPSGAVLAEVNALAVPAQISPAQAVLSRLYRRFTDRSSLAQRITETAPGRLDAEQVRQATAGRSTTALLASTDERRLVVAAAAPVLDVDSARVIAVLQVAQTADRWLLLRDRALTRLLNLTLLVTALAMIASFGFAIWLGRRLVRLKRASESALTRVGATRSEFPDTRAGDELGDVARSFAALLARLDAYTDYLRGLAGKLAHEIRTPLTIVRSSLENLESENVSDAARVYVQRARAGSDRLGAILQAMGAATRVEEAIEQSEKVEFDLRGLLDSAVQSYRSAFGAHRFALEAQERALPWQGAPDLIMQMLDKLIDNAVDFTERGQTITIRLRELSDGALIEVENPGPALPLESQARLFESLWQSRAGSDSRPHFGLGLYIVRLIAEFHGGRVSATSLPGEAGVRFAVTLPRGTKALQPAA
jgi:dedicated sortase system histidine kinase